MKKLFPKIKIILGNNAEEPRGVKSNYFEEDLVVFTKKYSQEQFFILGNKKWSQKE